MKKILVINAGSSSIKFKLFEENLEPIASGICERLYIDGSFQLEFQDQKIQDNPDFSDHSKATQYLIKALTDHKVISSTEEIAGIGHRVVQGGEFFLESVKIDKNDVVKIKELAKLAPLHNPGAVAAMEAFMQIAPNAINCAVFDTSFHQTMPAKNYMYAVPYSWYQKHDVRRYGAHGTSFRYIAKKMEEVLDKKNPNLVVCHLGNGASICAIKEGKSYNTSMGLTPLAGLVMGTRSGDIDPAIIEYMCNQTGKTVKEITSDLNKESGIKAFAGSADMRDLKEKIDAGDEKAKLILKIWAKRVADYILQYANDLENKLDAVVFTAGIGENSALSRKAIVDALHIMPISLDEEKNQQRSKQAHLISNSLIKVFVVPTNEELLIAKDTKLFM